MRAGRDPLSTIEAVGELPTSVETFMTIDEVATYLRVTVATIRWLRQEGRFIPASRVGRRLVWARSEVQAWAIAQREVAA